MENRILLRKNTPIWITTCALFMALTIALSSFGVPVPGGKLYLCDISIVTAALLLDPVSAMLVGGIGSFLGDMIFYPAPMFVSLVVHGLQAYVISWCAHNTFKNKPIYGALLGVTLGTIILVGGYTLGKIYVYSTFEYAMTKLPFEILQGVIGAVCGILLCYGAGLKRIYERMVLRHHQ
ncbi:ECF transporter S component [Ileibacterium valens]|uniref:ECF transporter S component n=1 Tax=Ileibacterium valens TaxID=1862668 RepID=A0A1U7NEB2_9FIRM|nr:ECF transporter S component [Ileibacterium valens]OLU36116.1 ECF transporter S component [Erysipelotrichaceae bacterium NYU-BL-F16]OLU37905.1 ECF transporter S component [Ileibacterium valens]OLU40993.1 ECF transporter S component [Erysipelotrichaceae bacterium NYU-BL-E8]